MKKPLVILFLLPSLFCFEEKAFTQTGNTIKPQIPGVVKVGDTGSMSFFTERENSLVGKQFPSFAAKRGGKPFSSKALEGKLVFVNFWFAACVPCMQEMDALNKLYDTLKNDSRFVFLSISFDPEETVKSVVEKHSVKYPVISVSKEECTRLNMQNGYPTSFLLDKKGIIRWAKFLSIEEQVHSGELVHSIYGRVAALP